MTMILSLRQPALMQSLRRQGPAGRRAPRSSDSTHESVLLRECIEMLSPQDGEVVLDATLGQGGHSEALLRAAQIRLIGLDADPEALAIARKRLDQFGRRATLVEANFRDLERVLAQEHVANIDKGLFDLGWNRGQLFSGRGFSFLGHEPLIMSYGEIPASGFTAREIVNSWDEKVIADALYGYGEERYARRIARKIIEARGRHPIEWTDELAALIADAVPAAYRRGRIHPATKTFQALRIAVNDELGSLEQGLRSAWRMLEPHGRLGIISFHSVEDRAVKNLLREFAGEGGRLLVKKPITASPEELRENPSARSAKLRGIEKLEA